MALTVVFPPVGRARLISVSRILSFTWGHRENHGADPPRVQGCGCTVILSILQPEGEVVTRACESTSRMDVPLAFAWEPFLETGVGWLNSCSTSLDRREERIAEPSEDQGTQGRAVDEVNLFPVWLSGTRWAC